MIKGVRLEEGKYGRTAVVTSAWRDEITTYLLDHGVVELRLNYARGWRGADLSFLAALPQLLSFDILDICLRSDEEVHFLHELRTLSLLTESRNEIRFSAFPHLQECSLEWRAKATSLFDCNTIKTLFLNRYNGRDTVPFGRLTNLESLTLLSARVENVQGLSGLTRLRYLRLGNLQRLTSLAGLEALGNLEELDVNTCRRITSIEEIGYLARLRRLHLDNMGEVQSLKPLERLYGLEFVSFYESTNIADGDLSPLTRQSNLTAITFQNRRHYSHRVQDFGAAYSG